ncbi:unnamed protein product [Rangifer tarandus platyrhynchus]|uniref:Uncharacterized protein n=2 Tax=Rangifer tarandus platyrhynchus TaxID=3082113 RepID=A0ACB0EM93_RANTA|nr:unnamed protein product [Rangifer tarandus platyrhynchus]CAI9701354.1 unnamed protein product [Rangifer tarandus platyrhynchus]
MGPGPGSRGRRQRAAWERAGGRPDPGLPGALEGPVAPALVGGWGRRAGRGGAAELRGASKWAVEGGGGQQAALGLALRASASTSAVFTDRLRGAHVGRRGPGVAGTSRPSGDDAHHPFALCLASGEGPTLPMMGVGTRSSAEQVTSCFEHLAWPELQVTVDIVVALPKSFLRVESLMRAPHGIGFPFVVL